MSSPDPDQLAALAPVRRQLRDLKVLTETRPGVFNYGGNAMVQFVALAEGVVAEVRDANAGSSKATTRFVLAKPEEVRKLIDEVKRRIARMTDD